MNHPTMQSRQRGLTLIEFMISIVLGMLMVAALATLIADQSSNRAEVDRTGRLLENGRFAIRTIADDVQMAGYWGELFTLAGAPATLPNPCDITAAGIEQAIPLHIQGYNAPAAAAVPSCVTEQLAGTDILVVRHADPDSSSTETGGVTDLSKLATGQVYIQTGLTAANAQFIESTNIGNSATNTTNFPLLKKDMVTPATVRKVLVRIYYVSKCSVQVSGSCTNGDGGNPIPTLKMVELTKSATGPIWSTVTIAEGIENMQVDYGVDTDTDGAPNGADVDGSALGVADWPNVMTAKIYLLARAPDKTPGFSDDKTYQMGTAGTVAPATTALGYKRHVFVQSVRLVNPTARRAS